MKTNIILLWGALGIIFLIIFAFAFFNHWHFQQTINNINVISLASATDDDDDDDNDDDECEPNCVHAYYTCSSQCGGTLTDVWIDEECGTDCPDYEYDCEDWQKCDPSEAIGGMCYCDDMCLEKPQNPVYYNDPTYSHRPDKGVGNDKVKLPVKLEWSDVPGWKNQGGPGAHKKAPYGPQSYVIAIEKTRKAPGDRYVRTVKESEFNTVTDGEACLLKSGTETPWHVKACCTDTGDNCGLESNFNFTTNEAPEPMSPYDPDWVGDKKAENVSFNDAKLKWCKVSGANSYGVMIYIVDKNGKDECHPNLISATEQVCVPYTVISGPLTDEEEPKTELTNAETGFFTKDTTYSWKVNACIGISGKNCTDWSQKWKFSLEDFRLDKATLYSPPNDPKGKTPVGLPVTLKWKGAAGTMSYVIEVETLNLTEKYSPTLSSLTLDDPKLKVDTFYKWRVKPCWDYRALKCEDIWSEYFTFRTTGRPPEWMEPEKEVALPFKFEWEDVPGAKSYVFKIQGDGLDLEKDVAEPEIELISELKQGKSYIWLVKTCAKDGGKVCGSWSENLTITISKIGAPSDPNPADGSKIYADKMPVVFSWKEVSGAGAYKISISYKKKAGEEVSDCPLGKLVEEIVLSPSYVVDANCLGEYEWQVQSCVDEKCKELAAKGPKWTFTLAQDPEGKTSGGLVVCGLNYDNPDTPWNERDKCDIAHLFILAKVIVEFVLFRLAIIVLVILVLITGIIFYWPFEKLDVADAGGKIASAGTILKVKNLWRAAGIGYLLLLFGWLIVSIILTVFGYQLGSWWHIKSK